jgi:hypothetical protein
MSKAEAAVTDWLLTIACLVAGIGWILDWFSGAVYVAALVIAISVDVGRWLVRRRIRQSAASGERPADIEQ